MKAAVSATREALASSFGDRCLAVYLMGSLARGGFSESVSDIDLGVVIAGPLEPSDSDRIALSAERGVAGDSVLLNAVSIFWGSVDSINGRGGGGRFPPFDRLDLLESAVLLHGRELREELVRPQQRELVVSSASFALQRLCSEASIENLGQLERIASGGLVSLTKTVLFAPRFVYLAQTGKVAANDAAAAHYCAQFSGPDAELVGCAVRWRSTPPPPTPAVVHLLRLGLVPLYVRFLDVYLPRLEAYDEPELAAGLRRWRAQLLPRLAEGNRNVARRYLERVLGEGDATALDELVAEDVVLHGVSGTTWRGRDALRGLITTFAGAVEQTGLEIECEIAEGETVVSVYTAHGRHVGAYYGVAASGNEFSTTAVNVFRIEDGRIRELRVVMDAAELVQQLTAEPPESAQHPG